MQFEFKYAFKTVESIERSYGVMVSTLDSESRDLGSIPSRTFQFSFFAAYVDETTFRSHRSSGRSTAMCFGFVENPNINPDACFGQTGHPWGEMKENNLSDF